MGEKSRYPSRIFAGRAAELLDSVELLRQFPLAPADFAPVPTSNREHWPFPAEAHGCDKLMKELNSILEIAEDAFDRILLPQLLVRLQGL